MILFLSEGQWFRLLTTDGSSQCVQPNPCLYSRQQTILLARVFKALIAFAGIFARLDFSPTTHFDSKTDNIEVSVECASRQFEMSPPSPSTPSEGEIVESDTEKATTSLRLLNGTNVDRKSRNRVSVSRSPTPYRSPRRHHSRTPSRSPYRESVGGKRFREEDHYSDRVRNAPRRSKPRYVDRAHVARRHLRHNHDEMDRSREISASARYDDRGAQARIRDKQSPICNSSPVHSKPIAPDHSLFKHSSSNGQLKRFLWEEPGGKGYEEGTSRLSAQQSVSDRSHTPVTAAPRNRDTEHLSNQTKPHLSTTPNITQNAAEYVPLAFLRYFLTIRQAELNRHSLLITLN